MFVHTSSISSGSAMRCTLIGCSRVLMGAGVSSSLHMFTTVVEATQLGVTCGNCGCGCTGWWCWLRCWVLVGAGLFAFSVHCKQECLLRVWEDLLFFDPSFTPAIVLVQPWGTDGGEAGWLCALQGSICGHSWQREEVDCTLTAGVAGCSAWRLLCW